MHVTVNLKIHEDGRQNVQSKWWTHQVAEHERLVEVWVSISVLDDVGLNRLVSDGDLDAGAFDAQKIELFHIANAPAHDLCTRH